MNTTMAQAIFPWDAIITIQRGQIRCVFHVSAIRKAKIRVRDTFGKTTRPAGKEHIGQSVLGGMTDWHPLNTVLASGGDELIVTCVTFTLPL
jgi:hypothetical protein